MPHRRRNFLETITTCKNITEWLDVFSVAMVRTESNPAREVFPPKLFFSDWRISYGLHTMQPDIAYFMSFYPPFCYNHKGMYHYRTKESMAADVFVLESFLNDIDKEKIKDVGAQDILAVAFCILRNKESIELFQEQKFFLDFGLKHYHLDNYYQDHIRSLCAEYYKTGTVLGKKLHLSIFRRF